MDYGNGEVESACEKEKKEEEKEEKKRKKRPATVPSRQLNVQANVQNKVGRGKLSDHALNTMFEYHYYVKKLLFKRNYTTM